MSDASKKFSVSATRTWPAVGLLMGALIGSAPAAQAQEAASQQIQASAARSAKVDKPIKDKSLVVNANARDKAKIIPPGPNPPGPKSVQPSNKEAKNMEKKSAKKPVAKAVKKEAAPTAEVSPQK